MIIGLTGGSGSGKSCAAKYFEKSGYVIIDFDKISRDVTSTGSDCLKEIEAEFGVSVIGDDGTLQRKALGEIVFSNKKRLATLNSITHKYILAEAERLTEENKQSNMIFDAPLLFQAGLDQKCDYVISILADEDVRVGRICQRDAISADVAKNRIASQPDDEFYLKKSDICIYNNGTLQQLEEELQKFVAKIS